MRIRLLAALLCAAGVLGAGPAAAAECEDLPKHRNIPVVDAANVVDPEAETYLAADLMRHHVTGNEAIVAATVTSTGGDDVSSYAKRLFDCWGIGDAESDNGVLILVAMRERRARIEVGAGLEERLGQSELEAALDEMVAPLRRGDVGAGLRAAAVSLVDDLGGRLPDTRTGRGGAVPTRAPGDVDDATDATDGPPVPDFGPYDEMPGGVSPFASPESSGPGFAAFVPVIVVLGIIGSVVRMLFGGGFSGGRSTWRGGFPGGYSSRWGGGSTFHGGSWHDSGSSGWSGGGSSSGGSSGSDSSFGGGSSGGGGASGSW